MRRLTVISILVLLASIIAWRISLHDASATGGAFRYTKHGGGTTDSETPCARGVNRGLGSDYGGNCTNATYYDTPEAGKYKSGECTHCHEPHASFGGSEPPPNTNPGPWSYLLMTKYGTSDANYSWLCWGCHDNINNINSSGSPPTMGRWGFYQGRATYQASSHYNSTNFYWPGTGETSTSTPKLIWPRSSRSALPSGNKGSCLNCHTPHGIKAPDAANAYDITSPDGSGGVPETRQTVASGNPSVTSDYMIPRQLISWEENLCERCHDGSPASATKNIQTEINKRYPSPSASPASGHPVDDMSLAGLHVVNEAIPVTTKHVECYDCHNPHAVKAPTGVLGDGDGGRVKGMKYADIGGTVRDPATGYQQPYIYEVCLRCHGNSFNTFIPDKTATGTGAEVGGTLRTTVAQYGCTPDINPASACTDGSNKRLEFDTATLSTDGFGGNLGGNRAYHPVAAAGRNTTVAMTNQLLGGLNNTRTINCTDCHNNNITGAGTFSGITATPTYPGPVTQSNLRATDVNNGYALSPVGPHGSTNVRVLRANYNTSLGTTSAAPFTSFDAANFALCFNCHNVNAFTDTDGFNPVGTQLTNFLVYGGNQNISVCYRGGYGTTNLHNVHLRDGGPGTINFAGWNIIAGMYTACANCHYNVHSNAEATNTMYGTGSGAGLPPHGGTRLVNFSPIVQPYSYTKPRWWYVAGATPKMKCNLICHGVRMANGGNPANAVDAGYSYYQ